ncbi:MAG: ATPase, T2SS/T4P/T4SS family [Bacillota bacterium]|nr:ATPase, T2SS/T4P/T4SS family [Bacillota bacterium]
MLRQRMRLGDILVTSEIITKEQLAQALEVQKQKGDKLGATLISLGFLREEQLFRVLGDQFGIPYIDVATVHIDPKVPKIISESVAKRHKLIPVSLEGNRLTIAMADPLDIVAQDDIRLISGMEVLPGIASAQDIMKVSDRYYDNSETAQRAADDFNAQKVSLDENEETEDAGVTNAPIVRLVNSIINQAVKSRASDIHFEPFEKYLKIRMRVDGELREMMTQAHAMHAAMVTRIKIMSKLNISEKRVPQDGRVAAIIEGKPIDMRVSILPTVYGEKVVIRLLDQGGLVVKKEQLGFSEHNLELVNKMLLVPEGIILLTGPTGSGKTTTLYSVLRELNKPTKNIITVEDPVEYRLDGINQVQVNAKAGLTFASGLRSILRQDPDIVMLGEIRDSETAEIAVRASITGHIVLSTIHTNDTISTISRLTDMGIPSYLVASAVVGIIAQRLVRKICPKCSEEVEATDLEKKYLHMEDHEHVKIYRGKGCIACGGSGYAGRTGIHEVLLVDKDIKSMISAERPENEIFEVARQKGLQTLNEHCIQLVLQGRTTVEELVRMTYHFG